MTVRAMRVHLSGLIGRRRTWSHDSDFGFVDQDADGYVSIWQPGRIIPRGDSDSGLSKSPTGWSVGGLVSCAFSQSLTEFFDCG